MSCDNCNCHEHHSTCQHCCLCNHMTQLRCTCTLETPPCNCSCHHLRHFPSSDYQTNSLAIPHSSILGPPIPEEPEDPEEYEDFEDLPCFSVACQTSDLFNFHQPVITIDAVCQTKFAALNPREPETQTTACQTSFKSTHSSEDSTVREVRGSIPAHDLTVKTPLSDSVSRLPQFQIPAVKIQSDMSTQSDPSVNETSKIVQAEVVMMTMDCQTESEDFPKITQKLGSKSSNSQTEEAQLENTCCQTGSDLIRTFNMGTQTPGKNVDSQFCQTNFISFQLDKWCQFPLLKGDEIVIDQEWEIPRHLSYEPPFARTPLVSIEANIMSMLNQTLQYSNPIVTLTAPEMSHNSSQGSAGRMSKSRSMPRIKTSTPTRQMSPIKFVDSSVAYQEPQQVHTGRRSVSRNRSSGAPGSARESRSSRYYNEEWASDSAATGSGHQFTFGCYEGPKLLSKPSKKQLGIKKGKSWENYVNAVSPSSVFFLILFEK